MVIRKSKAEIRAQQRFGTMLMLIGLLLLVGAGSLILYNNWDSERAGEEADAILRQIDQEQAGMTSQNPPAPSARAEVDQEVDERVLAAQQALQQAAAQGGAGVTAGQTAAAAGNGTNEPAVKPMPTLEIDGYRYIGTLEIPSLGIRLPVMDTWDYTRLKVSPCVYSGSYFTDDLVICGHNYARHFSPIKWVDIGSDVYFTTADMVVYHYTVSNRETVQPTLIDRMIKNRNNSGMSGGYMENWDMTLFTCNTGGQTRCAVRCVRAE